MSDYDFDMMPFMVVLAIVSAVVGWALIELIIWLFSFITITVSTS